MQSHGKIFLADDRGTFEDASERRYSTFNYGEYQNQYKSPFGSIYLLNDELLAANSSKQIKADKDSIHIIIPLRGELAVSNAGTDSTVDVEEIAILGAWENEILTFSNTYEADWVSFIHLGIKYQNAMPMFSKHHFNFSVDRGLVAVIEEAVDYPFSLNIGLFKGREEAQYELKSPCGKVLCFVISGAFEIEGRLLHERDSLGLWDLEKVEIEALSNHAILMLLELN